MSQQEEGTLRVWQFSESLEDFNCFVYALLGVSVAIVSAANRSTKQVKIAIFPVYGVWWERCAIQLRVMPGSWDDFAFASAEFEAY